MSEKLTVQDAISHPDFIPTFRGELKRLYTEKSRIEDAGLKLKRTPFDRLTSRGVFVYDDKLVEHVYAVMEQRSKLPSGERQTLLHLTYMTIARMHEKMK